MSQGAFNIYQEGDDVQESFQIEDKNDGEHGKNRRFWECL